MNARWIKAACTSALVLASLAAAHAQTYDKSQPAALALKPGVLKNAADADQIKRGAYLARAGDCTACHTLSAGPPYGGGNAFKTPFGTLYSTNISSDKQHGIGTWSKRDFARALRQGVDKEGAHLYPAMPYTAYTRLSDADIDALWAYFRQVKPVATHNKDNDLTWPFSWRGSLWFWNLVFFDAHRFHRDEAQSDTWNRGAYLVNALGHCGGCHTPRNFAMAKKSEQALSGAMTEGWHAPSLLSGDGQSLDRWSVKQIADYLRTGQSPYIASAGPMSEAVHHSLQYLEDNDLHAIGVYLKSLRLDNGQVTIAQDSGRSDDAHASKPAATNAGTPASAAPGQRGTPSGASMASKVRVHHVGEPAAKIGNGNGNGNGNGAPAPGERLYMDNCMACHLSGQGMEGAFPALAGNAVVRDQDPTNLLNVILHGAQNVQTQHDPTVLTMPNFDWRLNDTQVAALAAYVRTTFGKLNADAATIKTDSVASLRHDTGTGEASGGH